MNTQRRIAIGFVVYKPGGSFLERLKSAAANGFQAYVFDNSPDESRIAEYCLNNKCVKYLTVGKNVGLGYGLAAICAQAYYEDNLALIFFDQDTVFSLETLDFINNYHANHRDLENAYSVIAFFSAENKSIKSFQDVSVVINSGSLFFLRSLKEIGWHNHKYFVDGVDYEFCLRSKNNGFKIGRFAGVPGFDHSVEQADKKYKIFKKTYAFRAYPIVRIMDTLKANCKLILLSLFTLNFKYTAIFVKFFMAFMFAQLASRVLKSAE